MVAIVNKNIVVSLNKLTRNDSADSIELPEGFEKTLETVVAELIADESIITEVVVED